MERSKVVSRSGDKKRNFVFAGKDRDGVSPDFVGHIAVGRDAVGPDYGAVDLSRMHEMARHIVGDHSSRDVVLLRVPRQSAGRPEGKGLVSSAKT